MSVPRVLFVPTHRTGLGYAIASFLAEIALRSGVEIRLHHLGVVAPGEVWDRWGGSCFLDAGLYGLEALGDLYARSVGGAQLSLLAAGVGIFDECAGGRWTPAAAAKKLDAPVVLLVDCRGWGRTVAAVVEGIRARLADINLGGVILSGLRDEAHAKEMRNAVCGPDLPLAGVLMEGEMPEWDTPAPGIVGASSVERPTEAMAALERRLNLDLIEQLAGQRGFLPNPGFSRESGGPMVLLASGRGFTPWTRDAVELLRAADARPRRLDLIEDEALPAETAGVVLAGHLWQEALSELAGNFSLMRDLRVRIEEGLPVLALGGGMTYLLRGVQDSFGRSHELCGVLPASMEIVGDLEVPGFVEVKAEKDCLLLERSEIVTGWMVQDAELAEAPVSNSFAFGLHHPAWEGWLGEGVATKSLLCSRVLIHPASCRRGMRSFVAACRDYADSLTT